jgi:putative hydrolase of the HAD superfamily
MWTLALDVDGVLLDPDRHGAGHWTNDLTERFGIARAQLREAFFMRGWDDVVNGRSSIEDELGAALELLGIEVDVEAVLSCWFDADYAPIEATFELAKRAASAGCRVVLATNQEHRRAAYLSDRIGASIPLADVVYSADLGCQKHDPQFFELASERLGLTRDERATVVFVDDVPNNVEVARAAGWRAVHAPPGERWQPEVETLLGL